MKRPELIWNERSLRTYANQLMGGQIYPLRHASLSSPQDISAPLESTLANAHHIIYCYPLKYFILSHVAFFLMEFMVPIYFRRFSRFSNLSNEEAQYILNTLHHHPSLAIRLAFNLYKIPVLLSLKPPKRFVRDDLYEV